MVVTVMVVAYLVDKSLADEPRRLGSENSVKTTSKGWKGGGKGRDGGRDNCFKVTSQRRSRC